MRSITARLTFFYSTTTFILLTIVALFLYGTTIYVLHNANHQFLSNEIDILKNLLENKPNNRLALEQKVVEVPYTKTGSVYHYYIRILDDKRKIVLKTPETEGVFHKAAFFNTPGEYLHKEIQWWKGEGRNQFLLMQSEAKFGKTNRPWLIQVALDISYQQKMINQYQWKLMLVLLVGIILAILFGYIIARRGMRSLRELTMTTKTVTASSLHQRLDPESWPKELKTLGMAFNQMLDRIETSFSYLTQFSADLAHELRTPVNNLMGETEIALSQHYTHEEHCRVLESNLEELQRISQIIENLLFLARAENPELHIKKESLNVAQEVQLICEFYQAMADEKQIEISCEGHATLQANPVMFRRMVSNILSNALKYSPENSKVSFQIRESDGAVHITLTDTGIGIAQEHLPKIFNRFYRIDAARSYRSGGVGLGLAIVKSIAELHQGTVSIASELGKGTTVHLIFFK